MSREKKFRSSLFGYKKAEVVSYIEDYSKKAEAVTDKYKKESEQMAKELAEVKKELIEKRKETERLLAELESLKQEQEKIKEEYEKIKLNEKMIAETLIESKQRADEVVNNARTKADGVD